MAGLAAGGGDLALLGRQVREHGVRRVAVAVGAPRHAAPLAARAGLPGVEVLVRARTRPPS